MMNHPMLVIAYLVCREEGLDFLYEIFVSDVYGSTVIACPVLRQVADFRRQSG